MTWPPEVGQLWMAVDRWPATDLEPGIDGGDLVMVIQGKVMESWAGPPWWCGMVLGPHGKRFVKAVEGDLVPGDDPRICAPAA